MWKLSAYNKKSTGWRLGFKNRYLILTVLVARKSKTKAQTDSVTAEDLPPGS